MDSFNQYSGIKQSDSKKISTSFLSNRSLDDNLIDPLGCSPGTVLMALIATPLCAYGLSYLGQGLGYISGHIADFIPYVKDVAPMLAQRAGDLGEGLKNHDLNVQYYSTAGAISGFWGGFAFPWRLLLTGIKKS